jgi:hypothetical protein
LKNTIITALAISASFLSVSVAVAMFLALVTYRTSVTAFASDAAAQAAMEVAEGWADFVGIERVGSAGCRTYDIEKKDYIGPWPASADGRCHLRDLVRARIIMRVRELTKAAY